jgi:hypothetical protein
MTFVVNLNWDALDANTLLDNGFDLWRVEREDAGPTWVPVSPQTAWIPITENMFDYRYIDQTTSDTVGTYQAVPYNSTDMLDGTPVAVTAQFGGYCTIQDIRDQGYAQSVYSDLVVLKAINAATALIDKVTRQWFEPRFRFVSKDGLCRDSVPLMVPIIVLQKVRIGVQQMDLANYAVYNRHLTHGIVQPDDRANPIVAYKTESESPAIQRLHRGSSFETDRKIINMTGIFGYTDLGAGFVGETAEGSQIPLTYGVTPSQINRACTMLAIKNMVPFEDSQDMVNQSKVTEEKTRDQSIKFSDNSSSSSNDSSYGITGLLEVDKILQMYVGPLDIGTV